MTEPKKKPAPSVPKSQKVKPAPSVPKSQKGGVQLFPPDLIPGTNDPVPREN